MEGYRAFWIDVEPDRWGFFAIKKSGNRVLVYLDTQLIETIVLPSTLTGIALIQDIYGIGYGYADLDSVKVYNVVLSDAEIGEEL